MSDYIWISRWADFQHYRPERDRAPAWIKDYTKQMGDERYLQLSDRQRALLGDVRRSFAVTFGRLSYDSAVVSRHRQRQTRHADLEALNHAGFIEVISRETLEQRLEQLYSPPRAPARSREVDLETSKEVLDALAHARTHAKPRASAKEGKPSDYDRALNMTRNGGHAYDDTAYQEELDRLQLTPDERTTLEQLRDQLNTPVNSDPELW